MAKVAVVSGGTRGIGAAISKALKAAGYTVAANYAGNDEVAAKFKAETGMSRITRSAPKASPKSVTKLGRSISSSTTQVSPATPCSTK
jgi:NAD(P)-dependent dehydrogenase (short-subunit alcohol dehydrogenase family)